MLAGFPEGANSTRCAEVSTGDGHDVNMTSEYMILFQSLYWIAILTLGIEISVILYKCLPLRFKIIRFFLMIVTGLA